MKQEIEWKKPTSENLETIAYDVLLLKCTMIVAHEIREFVVSGRKAGGHFRYDDIQRAGDGKREEIAIPNYVTVTAFAVLVKDEEGAV